MKLIKQILPASILLTLCIILGCNEMPVPIPDFVLTDSERVVLVEYLTGVKCPNCPRGTATLKNMLNKYPENLAIVGIHGRLLTDPLPTSKYDFRNDFARPLEESFRPFLGKPAAVINRFKFAEEPNLAADFADLWPGYIESELQKPQIVDLLTTLKVDSTSRRIDFTISILPREDILGSYKLNVYICENKIIDAQESTGVIIPDYQHDHVLRHMMTAWDGDAITTTLTKGNPTIKTYSFTVPNSIVLKNIDVISAITNTSNKQVLQANLVAVK